MKSFLSNLNARLMIIHFIAFWFFAYAFFTLAFLHDYAFLHLSSEHMLLLNDRGRFIKDKEFIRQSGNFGLLAAYIISWWISSKKNWHWVNSVIIFVIAFALYNLGYLGWNLVHSFFQEPAKLFPVNSVWGYLTDGLILLAIGLILLLSKGIIRYIDHSTAKDKQKIVANKKAARTGKGK